MLEIGRILATLNCQDIIHKHVRYTNKLSNKTPLKEPQGNCYSFFRSLYPANDARSLSFFLFSLSLSFSFTQLFPWQSFHKICHHIDWQRKHNGRVLLRRYSIQCLKLKGKCKKWNGTRLMMAMSNYWQHIRSIVIY